MVTTPPEAQSEPEITGRHEVSEQQFKDKLKSEPQESILVFDLKTAFPSQISGVGVLPKLAERIWRRVIDEAMAETGGAYARQKGTATVHVWFDSIPAVTAKAKLPGMAERMADVNTKAHAKGPQVNLDEFFPVAHKDSGPQLSPEMAKLMQHGLTANPSPEILEVWMTRTTQSIQMAQQKTPMVKDIVTTVMKSESYFVPVWAAANEILVGAWAHVKTSVPHNTWTSAEPVRQDLIAFFNTCLQLNVLTSKKAQAIGFVPLRPGILQSKGAMDLILAYMNTLPPEVKKNLLVEVRGLPKGMPSPAIKKSLEALAPHVKAFMVDTGALSKDDYSKDIPKLHACGFELAGMALPEAEIIGLIKKYALAYKGRAQKMYIKGMASAPIVKAAKEGGFTYLSGNAVHAPEKLLAAMRQHPIKL